MMNRRSFMAAAGLLPAAMELAARAAEAVPANRNVKWAVSLNLWGYFPGTKFTDILDVMAATGFPGIRMTGFPGCLTKYGLTVDGLLAEMTKRKLNVVTLSWNGPLADPAQRQVALDSARAGMKFLAEFGDVYKRQPHRWRSTSASSWIWRRALQRYGDWESRSGSASTSRRPTARRASIRSTTSSFSR